MSGLAPCVRCGHGADEHRLRDEDSPLDEGAAFRCVADGCGCPDYVDEPKKKRG